MSGRLLEKWNIMGRGKAFPAPSHQNSRQSAEKRRTSKHGTWWSTGIPSYSHMPSKTLFVPCPFLPLPSGSVRTERAADVPSLGGCGPFLRQDALSSESSATRGSRPQANTVARLLRGRQVLQKATYLKSSRPEEVQIDEDAFFFKFKFT